MDKPRVRTIPPVMIRVLGTSHHEAPPSRLHGVANQREELFARLLRLQSEGTLQGAMLLSTCNRLEIILDVGEDHENDDLRTAVLGEHEDLPLHDHAGTEAATYLLRVATGLESLVRGEDQILGQLRESFKRAEGHGLLSAKLRVLRTQLMAAARDIRQRTGIAKTQVSVASLGARELEGAGRRLVVIGAGETGRLAVETLVKRGNSEVLLVNRTPNRAEAIAKHHGVSSMGLREFLAMAEEAGETGCGWDGILIAVDSKTPILDARHVRGMKAVVDVSMPGVLAEDCRAVTGLRVLDLDAIAQLVQEEGERRCASLDTATELVTGRASTLHQSIERAGKGTHLSQIVDQHVETALQELKSVLDTKLSHLSTGDQDQVREALLRATRRNAHLHLKDVRELSGA